MNDITAGTLVRWTCCLNDPRETVVVRGQVVTVYGRRFADVVVSDAGITVTLPIADLKRIDPGPRASAMVIPFRRRTVNVGGFDLTPGGSAA